MGLRIAQVCFLGTCTLFVAACETLTTGQENGAEADATITSADGVPLVERDVEAPEVFSTTDLALWDGRPSLGGVWVAAPDVTDPERVIVRNSQNGRFLIGALFKRERENPGPPLQLSSDAAIELDILPGQPTEISVVALRREQVPDPSYVPPLEDVLPADGEPASQTDISATSLDAPTPQPVAVPQPTSSLNAPYIQIGIFSIEENARNTEQLLRNNGLTPSVLQQTSREREFWRVIVGPAQSVSERASILRTVKGLGFTDAYAVSN